MTEIDCVRNKLRNLFFFCIINATTKYGIDSFHTLFLFYVWAIDWCLNYVHGEKRPKNKNKSNIKAHWPGTEKKNCTIKRSMYLWFINRKKKLEFYGGPFFITCTWLDSSHLSGVEKLCGNTNTHTEKNKKTI